MVLPVNANCFTSTRSCGETGKAGLGSGGRGSTGSAGGGMRSGSRLCSSTCPASGRCWASEAQLAVASAPIRLNRAACWIEERRVITPQASCFRLVCPTVVGEQRIGAIRRSRATCVPSAHGGKGPDVDRVTSLREISNDFPVQRLTAFFRRRLGGNERAGAG